MQNKLDDLQKSFLEELEKVEDREQIAELQNKFLWKKGELKAILQRHHQAMIYNEL